MAAAAPPRDACRVIINADDFGLHDSVNEAVERAFLDGVLTSASLMVGASAAADAIARAKRLSGLAVGLHIVLVDGKPVLPPERIPDLVDRRGRFRNNMVTCGMRFFFLPRVRAQLALEIEAQFAAFEKSGLALDHVDTHKHFHLHPTVLKLILEIGARHGMKAMRLPRARPAPLGLVPWVRLIERRLDRAGIVHNDLMMGLNESGSFDEEAVLLAISRLRPGVTEMYFHPALESGAAIAASMPSYRHAAELAALVSPNVRGALYQRNAQRTTFGALNPSA